MHLYDYTVWILVHVSMHVITLLPVSVQFLRGSSVRIENHVRIWVGGCLVHTAPMASDDISFILQARSCFLDNSSSFSLQPFCHTTRSEGLYIKMISMVFSHAHKVSVEQR